MITCTDMNHNQSSSSDYFMPPDLTAFEPQVLSSTMDSDHGDVLSVGFADDDLQFEF